MAVTYDQVLRANGAADTDQDIATQVLFEATEYVLKYISDNTLDAASTVPDDISDEAILACATDLFAARKAPFGQQMVPDGAGGMIPTRIGVDPLARVRPKLRPWCFNIGFAFPVDDSVTDA